MNAATSDASTSTEDITKGRPLCLFYFAHPFGVLSCEPPAVLTPAPAPAPAPAPVPFPVAVPVPPMQRPARPLARTLPPLRLPSPRDAAECAGDAWAWLVPERPALPPIELPRALSPAPMRARRSPRPAPLAGVRKSGARSRGSLVRLLRRAVATGVSTQGVGAARPAWQPRTPTHAAGAGAGASAGTRDSQRTSRASAASSCSCASASVGAECARMPPAPTAGARAMGSPPAPPPLRRRYSLPETVMRRYRIAREQSESEEVSAPSSAQCAARDAVRRAALLRRMCGPLSPACRCDARAHGGSLADVWTGGPAQPTPAPAPPPPRLVEVVVSQTSPLTPPRPGRSQPCPIDLSVDIDEYVSNILVDSLNSLSDRLENMTVSIGGEGSISVVEKEIKVKLQNKGVNTVVHLSPTSNNQIIFGNKELCERVASASGASARPAPAHERAASPCASLVDSLDDPLSPRAPPPPPPPPPPQYPPPLAAAPRLSASPLSHLQDSNSMTHKEKCESFFIRMNEDNCACEKENIVVADHMPEKIKQRLHRRHRRRELRAAAGARRGGARRAARDVQRQCAALLDALIDDAIARVARDELRCARIARRAPPAAPEEPACRARALDARPKAEGGGRTRGEAPTARRASPPPPPAPAAVRDRGPRRLYHKSEIHDGGKCIEILEIVEYAQTSRSSSETNSDESAASARTRKSRIPIPILDKHESARVRRASVPPVLAPAPAPVVLAAPERAPSSSVRFERVFDVIPEEKSSLSVESASEAPSPAPAPEPEPARRSAATSPLQAPRARGDESPTRVDLRGERRARRSVGTQWARSGAGGACARADSGRSSSEGEGRRCGHPRPPRASLRHARASAPAPADTDGWSLTLAGSCRAALPSRLDLRLRFPSRGAAPAGAGGSPRSDAPTECSDAKSQDTEWGPASTRARAPRDRLPALRPASHAQGGWCGRCRCASPGGAGGTGGAGRGARGSSPAPGSRRRRRSPYHAAELKTLAVLGSAIVPERRAPLPARRRPARTPALLAPRTRTLSYTGYL